MSYAVPAGATPAGGRRMALVNWLTDPRNPLVARVTVNRLWQQHFGRGIVATADNFGYTRPRPPHPELLDYLATEFITSGYSIKALHRLILNSATYRQSKRSQRGSGAADPENLLLGRFPLLRLDAESIRDCMLRASGELDLAVGGPYVPTKRTESGEVIVADGGAVARRSIYLQRRRTQQDSMLDVFDVPQGGNNCTRRNASTIALQSLSLLNSEFRDGPGHGARRPPGEIRRRRHGSPSCAGVPRHLLAPAHDGRGRGCAAIPDDATRQLCRPARRKG